jgi:hypothetical protein
MHRPSASHVKFCDSTSEAMRMITNSRKKERRKKRKREQAENYQWMVILGLTKLVTRTTIVSPS